MATRPVTDRAKESLFNILGPLLPGARFLDLFAGTGAIGIEALSRGAAHATFVEKAPRALADIRHNLDVTHLSSRAEVVGRDVFTYLRDPATRFDLVFVGPPQWQGLWPKTVRLLDDTPTWLAEDAVVVAQHDPDESTGLDLRHLRPYDERSYARVRFTFFRREPPWPNIAHAYNVAAETYAAKFGGELADKPFDRDLLDRYAAEVAGHGPVLDVGCGAAGHISRYLADHGVRVAGLDLSPRSASVARQSQMDLGFVSADMCHLPTRANSLTGILAFYSVIHLPRHAIPAAFAEFRRSLRPGGHLLVSMHGGEGELSADDAFGHQVSVRATLVSPDELTALAKAAGLTIRERHARDPYEGELQTQRLYLWATAPH